MTIIYVVTSGDYSDYYIHGVFSSADKANEYIKNEYRDDIKDQTRYIEEMESDLSKPVAQRLHYKGCDTIEEADKYTIDGISSSKHYIERLTAKLNGAVVDDYRIEEYILDRKAE
jgi:hypothetical protein